MDYVYRLMAERSGQKWRLATYNALVFTVLQKQFQFNPFKQEKRYYHYYMDTRVKRCVSLTGFNPIAVRGKWF